MNSSNPVGKNMDEETFYKALLFAKKTDTRYLVISGGEPYHHPKVVQFIKESLQELDKSVITVETNGDLLLEHAMTREVIFELMLQYPMLLMKITALEGIYPNYHNCIRQLKELLKQMKKTVTGKILAGRISLITSKNIIAPVGNAFANRNNPILKEGIELYKKELHNVGCYNLYQILHTFEGDLISTVKYYYLNVGENKPIIDENGNIKFGEYNICTTIANINDFTVNEIKNGDMYINIENDSILPQGKCAFTKEQQESCKHIRRLYKTITLKA